MDVFEMRLTKMLTEISAAINSIQYNPFLHFHQLQFKQHMAPAKTAKEQFILSWMLREVHILTEIYVRNNK